MPLYEYQCEADGQIVEVVHGMSVRYETWGELCEGAKLELGDIPADTPVKRLIGGGSVNNQNSALSKQNARHGEASKQLKHGPMAAALRNNRF